LNAPFAPARQQIRLVDLRQPDEAARIEGFVAEAGGTLFHRPTWLRAVEQGTGQRARGLLAEKRGAITGWLPLTEVHSPIFGRVLASSGFAVGGGVLAETRPTAHALCRAAEELAARLSCPTIELRGGPVPGDWQVRADSHCGFAADLAADDEAQLLAITKRQRAEVRKGLAEDLTIEAGTGKDALRAFFAMYSESVRNLGTPVFPRTLFEAMIEGLDADILTAFHKGQPVSSVLSFYHAGAVMPYWGGGTQAARRLRANERLYYELMLHARRRGCRRFDFGRSKTGSGPWAFKKNWGFEPEPLSYASWTAPGAQKRDADPTSAKHAARIAVWRRLPLAITNRLGPRIARGLG
jgi:FemAB-related protein (PEP-CTERM system-associated)